MLTNPCLCIFGDTFRVLHFINKGHTYFNLKKFVNCVDDLKIIFILQNEMLLLMRFL